MKESTLFVYGSFTDGHVHYKKIAPFVESKKPATAQGSIYKLEVGYPVFLNDKSSVVKGTLVTLQTSDVVLNILDEFHGYNLKAPEKSLFLRTEVEVVTLDGESITTYTYSINPAKLPKTAKLISSGDWESDSAQLLTSDLTDRQRGYVLKLGASSGRDIVPIDLQLYRELMNKGLIVDKGRRLALSALGKEVFRYLE